MTLEELKGRALQLERELRYIEARDTFELALQLAPSVQWAAEGRARLALALREPEAAKFCGEALAFHDGSPELQLMMIVTVATELGLAAIPLLQDFVERHPEHGTAHAHLAELSAEAGAGDQFADSYVSALSRFPANKELHLSYWSTLVRSGRLPQALEAMDEAEPLFRHDIRFALQKLQIANQAGRTELAAELLKQLEGESGLELSRAEHLLQIGRPRDAAKWIERRLAEKPDDIAAWAMIEPIWRLFDDPRHKWLMSSQPLYVAQELALSEAELDTIAEAVRAQHANRSQPVGQSVRGGTQTSGDLFLGADAQVARLRKAIDQALTEYVKSLPPFDPRHPLLKHRGSDLAYSASWSVRLTHQGFHAAHFHPGGILSSACYLAVPPTEGGEKQAGYLEIGRPPPELHLEVPPLATFQPKAGRIILFPSFLFHGTRPFEGEERLTVAFDVAPVVG